MPRHQSAKRTVVQWERLVRREAKVLASRQALAQSARVDNYKWLAALGSEGFEVKAWNREALWDGQMLGASMGEGLSMAKELSRLGALAIALGRGSSEASQALASNDVVDLDSLGALNGVACSLAILDSFNDATGAAAKHRMRAIHGLAEALAVGARASIGMDLTSVVSSLARGKSQQAGAPEQPFARQLLGAWFDNQAFIGALFSPPARRLQKGAHVDKMLTAHGPRDVIAILACFAPKDPEFFAHLLARALHHLGPAARGAHAHVRLHSEIASRSVAGVVERGFANAHSREPEAARRQAEILFAQTLHRLGHDLLASELDEPNSFAGPSFFREALASLRERKELDLGVVSLSPEAGARPARL